MRSFFAACCDDGALTTRRIRAESLAQALKRAHPREVVRATRIAAESAAVRKWRATAEDDAREVAVRHRAEMEAVERGPV